MFDLKNGNFNGNKNWQWGKKYRLPKEGVPPLNQWTRGSSAFAQVGYGIDTTVTEMAISNFEQHMIMLALGRGKELGYPTDAIIKHFGQNYINQVTHPDYNPYLLCNGRIPTVKTDSTYFTSWKELKTGYNDKWKNKNSFDTAYAEHYTFLGMTAVSYCTPLPGGKDAWAFVKTHALPASCLNDDPRWAIIPRDINTSIATNKIITSGKSHIIELNRINRHQVELHFIGEIENEAELLLFNLHGRIVDRVDIKKASLVYTFPKKKLSSGMYVFTLNMKNSVKARKPFFLRNH